MIVTIIYTSSMILAYLFNSNKLKESVSEDGVDTPKLAKKKKKFLNYPCGHENHLLLLLE